MNPFQKDDPVRPFALLGIALTGVFASAALGALTNSINGWVSPLYFERVMRWEQLADVWRASIAQGILEGLCFGMFFSLVFATGTGIITRASCSYGFAALHLLGVIGSAFVCWMLGGVAGLGLAALSPEFFQRAFFLAPKEFGPLLGFAWVGGSIWGVQLGGLFSVVLGLVILRSNWLRRQAAGSLEDASARKENHDRSATAVRSGNSPS